MSQRYSPHALLRKAREWPVSVRPETISIPQELVLQARSIWLGEGTMHDFLSCDVPMGEPSELLAEYGIDAIRIASLTAPQGTFPDISLLESALSWLAQWYERLCPPNNSSADATPGTISATATKPSPDLPSHMSPVDSAWNAVPWLGAAAAVQDHLFLRNRPYPALAAIKRAWKTSPVQALSPLPAKSLAILLLVPFAPILGVSLWNTLFPTARHFPLLQTLTDAFRPLRAIFIAMEKSGRRYEVVDELRLEADPRGVIAELPWLRRTLGDMPWTIRREEDCWRIHCEGSQC